jgi:hypothetical protein
MEGNIMSRKSKEFGFFLVLLLVGAFIYGCAFGHFGKANVDAFEITVPSGLNGQDKLNVLKQLGVPDSVAKAGGTEYWGFKNRNGFHIVLFGRTQEKDLVLEFKDGKVASAYLVDKGNALGIFTVPGAVAN